MVALKQSCCRKTGVKEKNSNDRRKHRKTGKPKRRLCGCEQHIENQTVHGSALFFVVQGETERGCLRNKLSDCPKMMVGVLLESCVKTETTWPKKEGVRVVTCCTSHLRWNHGRRLRSCSCVINGYLHATGR